MLMCVAASGVVRSILVKESAVKAGRLKPTENQYSSAVAAASASKQLTAACLEAT